VRLQAQKPAFPADGRKALAEHRAAAVAASEKPTSRTAAVVIALI
jgi:hypothetical protein